MLVGRYLRRSWWGAFCCLSAACNTYGPDLLEPGPPPGAADSGDSGSTNSGGSGSGGSGGEDSTTTAALTTGVGASPSSTGSQNSSDSGGAGDSSGGSDGAGGSGESSGSNSTNGSGGTSASTSGGSGGSGGDDCGIVDCCPGNAAKTSPGQCGCDEDDVDSDYDGTADCVDLCPEDPYKVEPLVCGCGVPDEDSSGAAGCVPLKDGLLNRYTFEATGSHVTDSVGQADGTAVGTELDGTGALTLGSEDEQFVELPSGMVSSLSNATLESWFVWGGGPMWTRLFDFGNTVEGVDGEPGTGATFVMLTLKSDFGVGVPYVAVFSGDPDTESFCYGVKAVSVGETHHVALSIDQDSNMLALYIDGKLSCAKAFSLELSQVNDVNCWIGRSQFSSDPTFVGSVDEFRIYDVALSARQVALSFALGPNPEFLRD